MGSLRAVGHSRWIFRFREFSMLCGVANFRLPSISGARRGAMQTFADRLRPCEALPWARSALSVTPGRFSGFVIFQCFAERKIFAAGRFPLRGSERCRRRVRKTGMAALVATWMTGTILGSSSETVIMELAALRAAEADHNAYGHMGSPVGECR